MHIPSKYRVVYLFILYLVVYCFLWYNTGIMEKVQETPSTPRKEEQKVSEEKPRTTEAQKRAKRKYMERFVEIKVRMTPERRSVVQAHAEAQGESTTAFINRAIDEAMQRDTAQK